MTDIFLNVEKYHERLWPGVEWVSFRKPSTLFIIIVPSYIYRHVGQTGFDLGKSQLFGPLQSSLYSKNNNHDCQMVPLAFLPFQKAGCNLRLVKQVNHVDVRKVESAITHSFVTAFLSSWKSISPVKFTHWNFWFYSNSCHQISTVSPGSRFSPFCNSSSSSTQFAFGNRKLSEPLSDSSCQSLWVFPFLPFCVWVEVGWVSAPVSLRVAGNGHLSWTWLVAESTFHQAQWVWGSDELTLKCSLLWTAAWIHS